jgi:hypothetical protein
VGSLSGSSRESVSVEDTLRLSTHTAANGLSSLLGAKQGGEIERASLKFAQNLSERTGPFPLCFCCRL